MMDIPFFGLFGDAINDLRFGSRSQGAGRKHLRLTSLEQACSVYARQQTGLTVDRTNFVTFAVVRTNALVQDHPAYGFLRDII